MARGYSLSLAAYAVGIEVALKGLARELTMRTALGIGAAFLVAVASNLTALIPCAGLAVAVACALVMRRERGGGQPGARTIVACCAAMVVPIGLAVVLHLAAMQWEIGRHHFWYGTT